ncbi:MAG: hypothetical protein ACR2QH_05445 [Geminicoccaceae bacterium]
MDDVKAQHELEVFKSFMACAGLPKGKPISRPPKEPDILFQADDGYHCAFELTEILDSNFKARLEKLLSLKKSIELYYEDEMSSELKTSIQENFSNADISIIFKTASTERARRKYIPELFCEISKLDEGFTGNLTTNSQSKILEKLSISRGNFCGPCFDVAGDPGWIEDPLISKLTEKNQKKYETQYPVNLLMYYESFLRFPEEQWRNALPTYVLDHQRSLQFAKIWVFDVPRMIILFEHEVRKHSFAASDDN